MKELFIDCGITQNRAAIFSNDELIDLYVENTNLTSINGNVYRGRIENIEEGLNAVFINIGTAKNAIMHEDSSEKFKQYKRGQEIIVQVIREGVGNKGPRVSTQISIPGKYVVLLPNDSYIGISKKIDNINLKRKIKNYFDSNLESGFGVIIRTEGISIPIDELFHDYDILKEKWKTVVNNSRFIKAPSLLFDTKNFYDFLIREYIRDDIDTIHLNRTKEISLFKEKLNSIAKGNDFNYVCNEFNFVFQDKIEKEIQNLIDRKMSLPSGGYIVIDYTEAFTCIDVNSGTYTGNGDVEETILNVNLEACTAIQRAVNLRRLSGIILIDFIDMKLESSKNKVIDSLTLLFKDDKSHFKIHGFTKLGILEITRTKNNPRLIELIYNDKESKILNPDYCFRLIENKCIKEHKFYNKNNFEVDIESFIYDNNSNKISEFISQFEFLYDINLRFNRNQQIKGFVFK